MILFFYLFSDENDFYYTPVERNFAQVQPPLYPNNRPATFFENGDNYRLAQSSLPNTAQQQLFNEAHTRFPSPNYNQHPSPFQLPTGRSQTPGQFYLNQPDFTTSQRQRFRPSFPHNFQLLHPASTKRPDISQIHSVAYQNDPSKPETFLGQITLNNPDIDFLQNGRFKNTHFDGNSLKSNNQQSHSVLNDDDIDSDNQDLFEPRVTTYNPNRIQNKPKININSNIGHISQPSSANFNEDSGRNSNIYYNRPNNLKPSKILTDNSKNNKSYSTSTEFKALLDLEPLLEDDIRDITSFRELMKNNHDSFDVQVIKSNNEDTKVRNDYDKYDSNPSASSMNTENASKEVPLNLTLLSNKKEDYKKELTENNNSKTKINNEQNDDSDITTQSTESESPEELEDETEYVEYYDEPLSTEVSHTIQNSKNSEHREDIYDEYESDEQLDASNEEINNNASKTFDVLVMKVNSTTVKDDNFKEFVDTIAIDQIETEFNNETNDKNRTLIISKDVPISEDLSSELTSVEVPSDLRQEIVSVVTTKSVVNGTISIPDVTYPPSTTKISLTSETPLLNLKKENIDTTSIPNTTENWIVVASVQTSRSVSGARFLPFPTVEQDEKKQVLIDSDDESDEETVTENPKAFDDNSQHLSSSTENINDKLDSIQSELSSAVLAGSIDSDDKNIAHITESTTEISVPETSSVLPTSPTTLNVFTLKSTQATLVTEKSSPEPLPVLIKKFTPRVATTTTPKPKKKPSFVTVMDELSAGLLPPGYKHRSSFKDRKITTTTTTTTTTTKPAILDENEDNFNETQGRSSGITSKNKVTIIDYKSLLPKDYKPPSETKSEDVVFKKINQDDLSNLLPPGYKLNSSSTIKTITKIDSLEKIDLTALLPKDYKKGITTEKSTIESKLLGNAAPVDITALLPPGFKINSTDEEKEPIIKNFKVTDISSLLPPGFKLNTTITPSVTSSTTNSPSNGFKVVFPSRPGAKPVRKSTTPKSNIGAGPDPVTPKIQKGWPVR